MAGGCDSRMEVKEAPLISNGEARSDRQLRPVINEISSFLFIWIISFLLLGWYPTCPGSPGAFNHHYSVFPSHTPISLCIHKFPESFGVSSLPSSPVVGNGSGIGHVSF